jgi:crotonobetainyl-CoA:carnitine CoA-transferase CaiB-like acyl-CoA transferase
VDVLAGYAAATAILGALVGGGGRQVEISLYDVALSALVNVAQGALVTGEEPARHGNAHPNIVPYQTFRAADGLVAVAAANDGLFRRLCEALERPELAADERFATNPARVRHRAGLTAELDRSSPHAPQPNGSNGSARPGSRSAACEACSRRSRARRSPSTTRRSARSPSSGRRSAPR